MYAVLREGYADFFIGSETHLHCLAFVEAAQSKRHFLQQDAGFSGIHGKDGALIFGEIAQNIFCHDFWLYKTAESALDIYTWCGYNRGIKTNRGF
ncbi:MAG: hypothetical protein ACLVBX_01940 [Faecalibacterium prausnitzii]